MIKENTFYLPIVINPYEPFRFTLKTLNRNPNDKVRVAFCLDDKEIIYDTMLQKFNQYFISGDVYVFFTIPYDALMYSDEICRLTNMLYSSYCLDKFEFNKIHIRHELVNEVNVIMTLWVVDRKVWESVFLV